MDKLVEYQKMSDDRLVDLLVNRYHKKLKTDIVAVTPLFERVVRVHGDENPTLVPSKNLFDQVVGHLLLHITQEEQILFPAFVHLSDLDQIKLRRELISQMRSDHQDDHKDLLQLKTLMNNFIAPPEACQSYQRLMALLQELVEDTFEHVEIENKILFPRFEVEA